MMINCVEKGDCRSGSVMEVYKLGYENGLTDDGC